MSNLFTVFKKLNSEDIDFIEMLQAKKRILFHEKDREVLTRCKARLIAVCVLHNGKYGYELTEFGKNLAIFIEGWKSKS